MELAYVQQQRPAFDGFLAQNNNKSIEVEAPSALNQCVDLIMAWANYLGIPRDAVRRAYARQLWEQPSAVTNQYFNRIPYSGGALPGKGDIVVFKPAPLAAGPGGHVSVANGTSNKAWFDSFDQNWNGKMYAHIERHSYEGVMGWLRPK